MWYYILVNEVYNMKLINNICSHLNSAIHYFMNGLSNLASSFVKRINDIGTQAISCVGSWFALSTEGPNKKNIDLFVKPIEDNIERARLADLINSKNIQLFNGQTVQPRSAMSEYNLRRDTNI